MVAVVMCEKNLDLIKGRVLVQTSPSSTYSTEATVAHARLYAREFQRLNISRDRFCIKILATGPGLNAARILQHEGIATLGTGVFSVEQAIACSQAGCLYISPYYNEVRTHEDPSLWPDVVDPALQHPFSNRIIQMLEAFRDLNLKTGRTQPLIKNAAYRSIKEAIASAELGCHSATMSTAVIDELAATPYDKSLDFGEPVPKAEVPDRSIRTTPVRLQALLSSDSLQEAPFVRASIEIDYLANGGANLIAAMGKDPVGLGRLQDAISLFVRAENASKQLIESLMPRLESSL
ncbi:hypothetical protein LTR84_003595 [Exophiala bonariae]|uniref:Transaldolase n=1 Tax=Exophiala bonariae TaxID=1690606 RepID=A0AAV9N7E0_9EURO|nr:hypothetical protein LTR84_003595 [Exophiala bonariae]